MAHIKDTTVLNFKQFNEHIRYKHFKMETIQNVIDIVNQGCG